MKQIKISLIQMNIKEGEPEENREHAEALINQAASQRPDIILLPEMWTTAYELDKIDQICDVEGQPTENLLSGLAVKNGVHIVAGSYASKTADKVYNTAYVFDAMGNNIAKYEKIHLFRLMEEHKYITAGNKPCTFEMAGIRCGLIICYDLRFPELTRKLALEGIQLLFVPAQWPGARLEHWITLLKARAIENQIYVAAVNRAGENQDAEFLGGSMLINPWGEIVVQGDYKEQILSAAIDLSMINAVRSKIDILGDRRPELY